MSNSAAEVNELAGESELEREVLEASGESSLEAVRTLVLRERRLTSLDEPLFAQLAACEVISLSNNMLSSLGPCSGLQQLSVLNVNFNRVSCLEPLAHCGQLRQLFATNNKISSIAPLARCPLLSTLSLFRNQLASLDSVLEVLRRLPALVELDLASNPCALGPPYRHRLVRDLHLTTLDGDALTELDSELAVDFFAQPDAFPVRPSSSDISRASAEPIDAPPPRQRPQARNAHAPFFDNTSGLRSRNR